MLIGVPKEIKSQEYRVGLTPAAVREYTSNGHRVLVEAGAGQGIGASDEIYHSAGAEIVDGADDVFNRVEMIVKVKEPQPNEWKLLREGQILFTYLHLAPDRSQTNGLLDSGVTAVAYETITNDHGGLPLLAPMSEVAGRLSIQAAAQCLTSEAGGRGLLMGGVPGVVPAKIVIIGGGIVGTHAARMAVGLGANVTILERSLPRLARLEELFGSRIVSRFSTEAALEAEIAAADVVIGAVLVPGATAPKLISRESLSNMKDGAVLVDVAIDQGGCFATSKPTTHKKPTYVVDNVIHYCVANMPGTVPVSSSEALNNATLEFGLLLARDGVSACKHNSHLRAGLNTHEGKLTCEPVAAALDKEFTPALDALSSMS